MQLLSLAVLKAVVRKVRTIQKQGYGDGASMAITKLELMNFKISLHLKLVSHLKM